MKERGVRLTQVQRDALWKWRWLGWRESTPAFKFSMVLLGILFFVTGAAASMP